MVLKEAGLTVTSGRPKYLRVADDLRAKIANGVYPVGSAIPSTSQLMATYEVSVTVARSAVRELKVDDLVVGQPGTGVFVKRLPDPIEHTPEFTEIMRQVEGLRASLDDAVRQIDARVSHLEETVRQGRTPRPRGR